MNILSALLLGSAMCTYGAPALGASLDSVIGLVNTTCNGDLNCCPVVVPINSSQALLSASDNDILNRFTITMTTIAGALVPGTATFNTFQSVGPNGAVSLVLQLLAPTTTGAFPQPGTAVNLNITLNPAFTPDSVIPLVYTVLSNVAGSINIPATAPATTPYTVQFVCPTDYSTAVFTIAQLGFVNEGVFTSTVAAGVTTLNWEFSSDIFTTNPILGTTTPFIYTIPSNFALPTNESVILQRIRYNIRRSATVDCVPEDQVKKMAVTAFINELACLFKCRETIIKPKPICEQSVFVEYITFVTSTLTCISYCDKVKPEHFDICKPLHPIHPGNACECVNREIIRCARDLSRVQVDVNVEVGSMFCDVVPEAYVSVCTDVHVVEAEELHVCEEISEFSEDSCDHPRLRKPIHKKPVQKRARATTSVSTYVYVAAGAVAVSVAVAVYVFVL